MREGLRWGCGGAVLALVSMAACAESPTPEAVATDVIGLDVDASDLAHRVFRVHEEIPVRPGPLTLWYPQWLPGNHAPTGPLEQLGGLTMSIGGQRVEWRRDRVDLYAFHVDVPAGASRLDLDFQFLSPQESNQGRIVVTPEILGLQWNTVVLYPAGASDLIQVQPTLTLPAGWQFGSALETVKRDGDRVQFKPLSLTNLVDSPLFAGKYFRSFDLDPGAAMPVHLDVVADSAKLLEAKPEILAAHKLLVKQAESLFGSRHYAHYDFLLAVSEYFADIGLEHHQSSENATFEDYLTEPKRFAGRDLLAHEYTHSWNGKFRRPAGLATPHFNTPMDSSLLWVYEGQTQYWGYVLAARSGLLTPEQTREALAATAATYDHREGRAWRSLEDTTLSPAISYRKPLAWPSWQRSRDYYSEGELIWLDVDTLIREKSGGRHSLDDFAKKFFGVENGRVAPLPYDFDAVVAGLNAVVENDWAAFLHDRLDGHGPGAPLAGLERAGWKLVYTDKPNLATEDSGKSSKTADFTYSLGMTISNKDGRIGEVLWDSPAFKVGLAEGTNVVAVNGLSYNAQQLQDAITAAQKDGKPIELLVQRQDHYQSVRLDYKDGLRHPHLERIAGKPDRLDAILKAR
jgi:predicted metalloprotease with PDZ domain